jgi:hypothetical protein
LGGNGYLWWSSSAADPDAYTNTDSNTDSNTDAATESNTNSTATFISVLHPNT